jgi:HK97 gp10 family phage protein
MPTEVNWYGDDLLKQIRGATPDALYDGAEMLVEAAKANAPEMSGNLKESAYAATSDKSDKRHNKEIKPKEGQAVAAFAMFYAGFREYGTRKKAATPFLRPAMDELKGKLGETVVLKIAKKFR